MRILPAIPRDPPARLRLMSLWFAIFAIGVHAIETVFGDAPVTARVVGTLASVVLAAWVLRGYERGRFPRYSTPVEALLMIPIVAASALPLRGMGVFLALALFRPLYVTAREFWVLPVSYAVARMIGMAVTVQPAPYGPLSSTVMWQCIGILIIAAILFTLAQAMEGQARAEAQLREAQKMEAVGQLAGGVAHDFNNLLTVIGGHVFMLEQIGQLGPAAVKHLEGITQTAERAGTLTRQLLAFGRRQVLHPTTVDLNAVVRDAAGLLAPVVGERVELMTVLEPALAPVHADVGQLEQVLLNLGLNARDAMPNGGVLRITTANVEGPSGPQVRVTFEDSGIGMDAKTMARVFEPFFTTKSGGRGTGLGLATAYGIIKQSSGELTVASTPGQGSVFTITLPVAASATTPAVVKPGSGAPSIARSLGVARVLLVEDNDGVRDFAREVLVRSGSEVSVAANGVEGLEVARKNGYAFDLVVTDIVMPEMSGTQMAARLREVRPEIRVLFMTGYADDPITRTELVADRETLIEKPFTARVLREAIQSLTSARAEATAAIP